MTTEEDFQAMLDAAPDDHTTRAVFADWLDDRGDPRGPGYRELARRRLQPNPNSRPAAAFRRKGYRLPCFEWWLEADEADPSELPAEWFRALKDFDARYPSSGQIQSKDYLSRRAAENAAALAWAALRSSAGT